MPVSDKDDARTPDDGDDTLCVHWTPLGVQCLAVCACKHYCDRHEAFGSCHKEGCDCVLYRDIE